MKSRTRLTLVIRFFYGTKIEERFVTFIECVNLNGASITSKLIAQLKLDLPKLSGQCWLNNYTLVKKQSRLDVRKYSFSQRTINVWNKLSTDCVHASSVNMFKNKIDKYLAKVGYT